jgi:2-polyprenyl-3-methyl-5-hydroxy-6-metoxy-1,4-benzoquinol methylase
MRDLREKAYTTPRADVFAMVPSNAMTVLDVGCSNGALGGSLRLACPGRRVTGIEGDPAFVEEAKQRLDLVIHANLDLLDWKDGFGGEKFDCIVFADVLEHLLDPMKVLSEARKCLTPFGSIVISLPNIRHVSALYSIFFVGTFPQRDRGIFDRTHLRWFTLRDAEALVADAGLKVEEVTYTIRIRDRGDGILNKIARKTLEPIRTFSPIREFLAYQYCLRARKIQ